MVSLQKTVNKSHCDLRERSNGGGQQSWFSLSLIFLRGKNLRLHFFITICPFFFFLFLISEIQRPFLSKQVQISFLTSNYHQLSSLILFFCPYIFFLFFSHISQCRSFYFVLICKNKGTYWLWEEFSGSHLHLNQTNFLL